MELSHIDSTGRPRMVDVGNKKETSRTAIARGEVLLNAETLRLLKAKALPKGDVLTVAQIAGILAAKRTAELIPMCHPLPLTNVDVRFKIIDTPPSIIIESSASNYGKTGVEMEAIIAVQVAASTIYDMVKAVQKDVVITNVQLILKSGGKSGLFKNDEPLLFDTPKAEEIPEPRPNPYAYQGEGLSIACITLSDKCYSGQRIDESSPALLNILEVLKPAHTEAFLLPDEPAALCKLVRELVNFGWGIIVTTGGTGLSPRDLTPEALIPLLDRRLPGFEQAMFAEGLTHTPRAVLSRCLAGTIGKTLIIALPGSKLGAAENLSSIISILPHALEKLNGDMSDCGRH